LLLSITLANVTLSVREANCGDQPTILMSILQLLDTPTVVASPRSQMPVPQDDASKNKRRSRTGSTSPHASAPTQRAPAGLMQRKTKAVADAVASASRQLTNRGSKAVRQNKNQGSDAAVQQGNACQRSRQWQLGSQCDARTWGRGFVQCIIAVGSGVTINESVVSHSWWPNCDACSRSHSTQRWSKCDSCFRSHSASHSSCNSCFMTQSRIC